MIWHPLVWVFWAATVTGGLLYTAGAIQALDVVLNWAPARADMDQLRRERRAESARLLCHWSLGCLAAAAMLGLAGIALVWHRMVPGAMCGTGVLQAMGTAGSRAMIFWGVALIILFGWRVLDRLDSHLPEGELTQSGARVMLSAAPFLGLAIYHTWQALVQIEAVPPVSCCAAVYDQVLKDASGSAALIWLAPLSLWCSLAVSAALLAMAILKARFPSRGSGALLAIATSFWGIMASVAVKQVWSAYYYQVLSHPCPWCLFLPDFYGAGFFIFGWLAAAVLESIAIWLADRTRRRYPALADPAGKQIRRSAGRLAIAMLGFTVFAVGPAIAWRLRTGAWLDGLF